MSNVRHITDIKQITQIPEEERKRLAEVTLQFQFRANDYYLRLINWDDPQDPIRKLIIPNQGELKEYGDWDASDEESNYVVPGCQHKYRTTALLLVSDVCGAYCRYCFRKRLFRENTHETSLEIDEGLDYIRTHAEITNVLLTGGDPLVLSARRIRSILNQLADIPHIRIVRFGSKLPVFQPMRIYEDNELLDAFANFTNQGKTIYVVTHINHPREMTEEAHRCFRALHDAGVIMVNQTPILRGINDHPAVLAELLDQLSWAGVTPYYFFINRPVIGNADFVVPLKRVYDIVEQAKAQTSGLGKRVRLVMSHTSGKIEILAIEDGHAYLKYHQPREGEYGKFMVLPCPDEAAWFDDLPGNEKFWNKDKSSYRGE